ncbi:plasmid partition protein ParG [Morganella morganii]|uniref:plasmid partition protein ParG n=1 Tax=Morganella morganii TaxID=582 RepID=UPI0009B86DE0|nr:plasmid partition protein ParG [Morganella morganii]
MKKIISAKSTETQKRVNFNMPENKHQRLKATCARKGLSISDVMNDLVDNWLLKNE